VERPGVSLRQGKETFVGLMKAWFNRRTTES